MAARSPVLRIVRDFESDPARTPAPLHAVASSDADARSIGSLYQRYAPYIAAIATRILGRESEVEDVVQDVFAAAVNGLRRREDDREIKAWLARVTVRCAIHAVRLRRVWNLFDLTDDPSYEALVDSGASSEERQLIVQVYRVLDTMAPRHRVPWALRYIEGRSMEEVAELCGCSLATAKRRVSHAHERICARLGGGRR
jgi:RNA polymerase sigma-70 factor, ECF subfamily